MTKFIIPSYDGPMNTIAMQNCYGVVVRAKDTEDIFGLLIRWHNNQQAYICWDSEEVSGWASENGSYINLELCELDNT